MDRADSFGAAGGPLFLEVRSALYDLPNRPVTINKIFGLGGRDLGLDDIRKVYSGAGDACREGPGEITLRVYNGKRIKGDGDGGT